MSPGKAYGPPLRPFLCYLSTSGELCTSHLWSFLHSSLTLAQRQYCSRQLCGDTVFVFAGFCSCRFRGFFCFFCFWVFFVFFFAFFIFAFQGKTAQGNFPIAAPSFVMASSQMHCRWPQQLHSPKHIWVMALSALSVTDVALTNLITACSIPWPILVNGVPEVSSNQVLIMGTLKVRIPSLTSCFVLFDV